LSVSEEGQMVSTATSAAQSLDVLRRRGCQSKPDSRL
jgi:hypothetical protein